MLNGAPEESLDVVYSSDWMTGDNFLKVIKHFVVHILPSNDYPVIVTMNNHESHISNSALEMFKQHYIHILTFPLPTPNQAQPSDRSVFAPLKASHSRFTDAWMLQYPGRHVTVCEMKTRVGTSFMRAATPLNI
ncbi:tigger transposable element-derived protein [Plakobranchus ocellatus]|uniref:Tigger transposable element-derived protein n=1 Tax=Plakobranchus ocellatus TaxID=259542 RepID=A0AAV4AFD5_9GAST|nr:tigger transposable element-derived protein [Plakobranchus ocellatus]